MTTTPVPRRRSRKTSGPRITVLRRAVIIETVPEPRSEGDPRHLALTAHSTRRAGR